MLQNEVNNKYTQTISIYIYIEIIQSKLYFDIHKIDDDDTNK